MAGYWLGVICRGLLPAVLAAAMATHAAASTVALLPLQDRAGNPQASLEVQDAVAAELMLGGQTLVDQQKIREILRRARLRNPVQAPPSVLQRLASDLEADWLVSVTVHVAIDTETPRLTLSGRLYGSNEGELAGSAFRSVAGLDRRRLLGVGEIHSLSALTRWVAKDFIAALMSVESTEGPSDRPPIPKDQDTLSTIAMIPFSGQTGRSSTASAETVTEVVQMVALRRGLQLVSPNRVSETLRQARIRSWGGVEVEARELLRSRCGVTAILTGSVEQYKIGAGPFGPEAQVAISMRLVDAVSGTLIWSGALEHDTARHPGAFGLRRVNTVGSLALKLTERLIQDMMSDLESG